MLRSAVQTFEHKHHGHHAAGARMPAQQSCCQEVNQGYALFDSLCKTGRTLGSGPFALSFLSRRLLLPAADRAGSLFSSRALKHGGSARLLHNSRGYFADWAHGVGASASLLLKPLFQRKAHLSSYLFRAPLHTRVLSFFASFDASTKAWKAFHDAGKTSHERGQISQEQSHV